MRSTTRSRHSPTFLFLALSVLTAACSGGGSGLIEVIDSWTPSTPPGAQTAAIYLSIENGTDQDDRLVAVSSDACEAIELHATQIDEDRIMRMRPAELELLSIAAGETLEMMPGGLHVMCIGFAQPFEEGDQLALTVVLESTTQVAVTTLVEDR